MLLRYQAGFTPTLVNRLSVGANGRGEWRAIEDEAKSEERLHSRPNAPFGGIPGAVNLHFEGRSPLTGSRMLTMITDNFAKTQGMHILKFGFSAEREFSTDGGLNNFNGAFRLFAQLE